MKTSPASKSAVTVANTSTQILPVKIGRSLAIIQAASGNSEVVFLAFGEDAVLNTGIALNPGQDFQIDADVTIESAVNGISASGGQTVYIVD